MHLWLRFDVDDVQRAGLLADPDLCAWIATIGEDANRVRAVSIYADGDGLVEFDAYRLNENGRKFVVDGDVARERVLMPLTVPLPARITDALARP